MTTRRRSLLRSVIFQGLVCLGMIACVSTEKRAPVRKMAMFSRSVRYYSGQIEVTSMDGLKKFAAYPSLVRRSVESERGRILECVFQQGKAFVTEMSKTKQPLVYNVRDLGGFSTGRLIMEDGMLNAWSYEIDVLKPQKGKITGNVKDHKGGRIYPDGHMTIQKVWNEQSLISESYEMISEEAYQKRLAEVVPADFPEASRRLCE